jgi:hypothetical protein
MKVLIIIPYFGTLPPWMDHFLETCRYNPGYSWLILSDAGNPGNVPPNVMFKEFSLDRFNRLASNRLGMEINIRNPYKLCDYRPAYGIVFRDFLDDFQFWGYSDLDLVYGRLENFIGRDVLTKYDVISAREEYLSGHFTLYRNADKINNLFRESPVYSKVFSDQERHYAFDERSNVFGRRLGTRSPPFERAFNKLRYKLKINLPETPADMNSVTEMVSRSGEIRLLRRTMVKSDRWFSRNHITGWKVSWSDGILKNLQDGKELLHFHFILGKDNPAFSTVSQPGDQGFIITSGGIRPLYSE